MDAIIIGGGHNGLVCAFYLARAGLKVTVLERRHIIGGAAVTEEFLPGFRNSTASYTVSLLNPKIIRDMDLEQRGLRIVERHISNFLPLNEHEYLAGATAAEVGKFSKKDAETLPYYLARMETIADVLRELVLQTPPNFGEGSWREAIPEMIKSAWMVKGVSGLGIAEKRDLLALFTQSGGEWLAGWFESEPIKALLGFDSIVGNYASPFTPGSAYVLLHHLFGEVNGKKGVWGHAIGGMGSITAKMAEACREHGVELRTDAAVREVVVEKGCAAGVVLEDGGSLRAARVISNVNPKLLFTTMVDRNALPNDFRERMERYRSGSGSFRMNVALSELPRFSCKPDAGPLLNTGIVMAPSLAYMDRAYIDARAFGWSREPIVEMLIPTLIDDSLAPPGRHVASLFCQQVAPELSGRSWDEAKGEVSKLMIATVDRFAPGFAGSVLGYSAMSPLDLERVFGLTGGDIMHGRLDLDQMFSARPTLGHGNYRSPIKGLYMCGAGTHPGGGVTGAPGHNAAREILKDAGKRLR